MRDDAGCLIGIVLLFVAAGLLLQITMAGLRAVDPSTEIQQTCEPYADHPFTVIPAKCMGYFINKR